MHYAQADEVEQLIKTYYVKKIKHQLNKEDYWGYKGGTPYPCVWSSYNTKKAIPEIGEDGTDFLKCVGVQSTGVSASDVVVNQTVNINIASSNISVLLWRCLTILRINCECIPREIVIIIIDKMPTMSFVTGNFHYFVIVIFLGSYSLL